jgi:predicted flap endonuclease-1-like 5' DNA nuclease/BMFP domain-containing protein YqiC
MQWLIANMWMALAAATVLGLLFGFSFRGILAGSKIRKAEVEREIARTELTQSKAEVEALYAAQRKYKESVDQGPSSIPAAELQEREGRIAVLSDELASARSELEQLKSENASENNMLETAGAAVAGAVAGAVLSDDDQTELTALRDRNAWLEERVGALETEISAAAVAPAPPIEVPEPTATDPAQEKTRWQAAYLRTRVDALEAKLLSQAEPIADTEASSAAPEPIVAATPTEVVADPADEKVRWQAAYLRTRVDALEAKLLAQAAATPNDAETAPMPEPEPEPTPQADTQAVDEELAQLRWRNRYLEGRLAYFEQAPEEGVETVEETVDVEPTEASEPEPAPEPEAELVDEDTANEAEDTQAEPEPEPEVEIVGAPEETPEVHPSEAMLAELDGKQPLQIDRPSDGGDDLTKITGIGPRIAEVLNGLGIYTFAQIADWKSENATWIENHLSFKGRVSRENWVQQSKDLLVEA